MDILRDMVWALFLLTVIAGGFMFGYAYDKGENDKGEVVVEAPSEPYRLELITGEGKVVFSVNNVCDHALTQTGLVTAYQCGYGKAKTYINVTGKCSVVVRAELVANDKYVKLFKEAMKDHDYAEKIAWRLSHRLRESSDYTLSHMADEIADRLSRSSRNLREGYCY